MALDYQRLMGLPPIETPQTLTVRDTILYALGVGAAGEVETATEDLQFVYEAGLKALPTMVVVLGYPGFWQKEPAYGFTWRKILHGEQSIELHRPLPVEGDLLGVTTIDEIYDKGADKGALLTSSRRIYDATSPDPLATVRQSSFLRGDGGFGGPSSGAPKPHLVPDRAPDLLVTTTTRIDQALLYRLSGDYNPLHADPGTASEAGFAKPILHGLATYGIAGRVILRSLCANDPSRLRRMDTRFTQIVYPGDALEFGIWREGRGRAAFAARAPARDASVLQNGYVEFAE